MSQKRFANEMALSESQMCLKKEIKTCDQNMVEGDVFLSHKRWLKKMVTTYDSKILIIFFWIAQKEIKKIDQNVDQKVNQKVDQKVPSF